MGTRYDKKTLSIEITAGVLLTANANMDSRDGPVEILRRHDIAACLWSEDALSFYGVPTVVFELYLLIPDEDLDKASTILSSSPGYQRIPPNDREMEIHTFRQVFLKYWSHRFMGPWSDITGVQLLPAQEFAHFTISKTTTIRHGPCLYPKLADFIEALVEKYLETTNTLSEVAFMAYVRVHLFYLAGSAVDKYVVLDNLSPKARLLWTHVLEDKMMSGKEGLEMYRKA